MRKSCNRRDLAGTLATRYSTAPRTTASDFASSASDAERRSTSLESQATDHTFNKLHLYIAWGVILVLALFEAARIFLYEYHDLVSLGQRLGIW
jgi:hypothetical protein